MALPDLGFRVVAAPLLAVQAVTVIRSALRLPEAAGPRQGVTGNGADLRLLILGDSSAAGVGVAHQDQALLGQTVAALSPHARIHWALHAKTGATTRSTLAAHACRPDDPFDVVVVALGVNDVTRMVPLPTWRRQQLQLLTMLQAKHAPRRVLVCGLPPMGQFPLLPNPLRWTLGRHARQFEAHLATCLARHPFARHAPLDLSLDISAMAEDGYHPGPDVYAAWGKQMASRILSDWPPA